MFTAKITQSYRALNSLHLGLEFIREFSLVAGRAYPIVIAGMETSDLTGTLQKSGLIGGLAAMYERFPILQIGVEVEIDFDGTAILIRPPGVPSSPRFQTTPSAPSSEYVLDRLNSRRVYIPPYAHGSLNTWEPRGEPDVYMVFGRLAEFTRYRYCCASNQAILDKLGISIEPKPDVVLIEQGTDLYVIAEVEVFSSSFIQHGHRAEDIDVLVCWHDDVTARKIARNCLGTFFPFINW